MIAPYIQVQVQVRESGRQLQQSYSVTPLETLGELFSRIAREHHLSGSQSEWEFQFNGQAQTWASTVGEVARFAGDPAVLVLTLVRVGPKQEEGDGAGGDWASLPQLAARAPARPAPSMPRRGGGGGFAGSAPSAPPAPAALPSVTIERRREEVETVVLSEALPSRAKAKRAAPADVEVELADEAMELRKSVTRQAAVRYYHRMNPLRVYPFLVVLSAEEIAEIVQKGVKQATGERFDVHAESPVEIEPVLPGCQCYPPKHTLVIGPETQTLEFWVVPQVLGTIRGAKVIVRQDGSTLSEVKLEAKVVKQTAAVVVGLMSFVMPYVSKGLKSDDPDGTKLQSAMNWVSTNLRPEMIWASLALLAVGLYLWCRPRKRDQFWDVTPKR